jgi:hypothetical protein
MLYEKQQPGKEAYLRIHVNRIIDCDSDNSAIDGYFSAGVEQGQETGQTDCVFEQYEAAFVGVAGIRGK